MQRSQRQVLVVAGMALGMLLLLHASPVLLWHLQYADYLEEVAGDGRLSTPSRNLAEPPADWTGLRVANLSLRAPIEPSERDACATCRVRCVLSLEDGGTLAVFDREPREDLGEARDRFGPHPEDLSLLRSMARNWETIDALTDRARAAPAPPLAFRFDAAGSRGVATGFMVAGRPRWVIYAYGPDGTPTRTLGLTGVTDERLDRILGGLAVSDAFVHGDDAGCRAPGGSARG